MKVNVLLFATLKDLIGEKRLEVSLPEDKTNLSTLRAHLVARFPNAEANLNAANASINQEFAFDQDIITDGDEVAFFPSVSGGGGDWPEIFRLPHEPVDHDAIVESITTSATGAVCLFSGMVRGETDKDGHLPQTDYLEYEAYEPMALAKMRQVADEIREQWPLVQGIAIMQRLGRLEVGQNTVLIACSSGHRDEGCFEAARYGIDRLKEIVPVWKKEIGSQGETWIEGEYTPEADDKHS